MDCSRLASLTSPKGKLRKLPPLFDVSPRQMMEIPCCLGTFSMPLPIKGWPVYGVNNQCAHNEYLALQERTIIELPDPPSEALMSLRKRLSLLPQVSLRPKRGEELIALFARERRKRYQSCQRRTFLHWSAKIKAFTKMERIPIVKRGKPKAPRLIQARAPEFNLLLASFTKPLEHHLYQWEVGGLRVIAKGLNLHQRANLLLSSWSRYKHPMALSLDCTDWDGHVSPALLRVEHEYYLRCYSHNPQLKALLDCQLINRGSTLTGLRYSVHAGRMSGDMNTALGNCVLAALLAFEAVMRTDSQAIQDQRVNVICDGDDTILIGESDLVTQVARTAPACYAAFGHVLRVDGVARDIHQVEFCQHKPFRRSDGLWVMCPDPKKVLQTSFMATGTRSFDAAYFGTLWEQRARIHTGVPCYAKLFARLARQNPHRLQCQHFFGFEHADPDLPECAITLRERALFASQWGLSIEEQCMFENAQVEFRPDICAGEPAEWGK